MIKQVADLQRLEKIIGVKFNRMELLNNALIHTSYSNENRKEKLEHNERLEFLGDAVLELVISEYLYRQYPGYAEGELTKLRAAVVCEPVLARQARKLNFGTYLRLGRGEESTGGRERPSILADAFEAVVGAIYLDGGLAAAAQFILKQLVNEINAVQVDSRFRYQDYKTALQEYVQKYYNGLNLLYAVVGEEGPDHDKRFYVEVRLDDRLLGEGSGKSKKEAEQAAAQQALHNLQIEVKP